METCSNEEMLYYDRPARLWVEALPLGNGALGAMVFGGTHTERIGLNLDTLWTGYPGRDVFGTARHEAFLRARQAVLASDYKQAEAELTAGFEGADSEAYMPLGDLSIQIENIPEEVSDYSRSLSLTDAVARTSFTYRSGDVQVFHTRETFVSFPHGAMVTRLVSVGGTMTVSIGLDSQLLRGVWVQDGMLCMEGECPANSPNNRHRGTGRTAFYNDAPAERGVRFLSAVTVRTDGTFANSENRLQIRGATYAEVILCAESSYNGFDRHPFTEGREYRRAVRERLQAVGEVPYETLLAAHLADYRDLYGRVSLHLGGEDVPVLPTDQRLILHEQGRNDPALYTLLFQYGRYLTIAGSRAGTQPLNLQGIWNDLFAPPWNSNYTVNINTEMNYWPTLPAGLAPCMEPLLRMVRELRVTGAETARRLYNAPGFVCHHNTDLWRLTVPVQGQSRWSFWPMASGWLCRHVYDYWLYTADNNYLQHEGLPTLLDACAFYLSLLTEDEDGFLILAPSTSPENAFRTPAGTCAVSETSSMSMAIVRELFANTLDAAAGLKQAGMEPDADQKKLLGQIAGAQPRLLPYRIGSDGRLLEWYREMEETEPHHRHISHLYGLHPAHEITPDGTPGLADAARATLAARGDAGTGWSLGWKINFHARLGDGDRALHLADMLLHPVLEARGTTMSGGGTCPNLFNAHPPFQIDGNFGACAGILEMLLQARGCDLYLLPALPSALADGRVSGLCAPGGAVVSMTWAAGKLTGYSIKPGRRPLRVHLPDGTCTQIAAAG